MEEYMQYAKDLAKAERELKIEHWVYISFEIKNENRNREILHKIDIPRVLYDRWQWVIEWRRAKLVCKYPRKHIWVYHSYYDKRTGLETGFGTMLGKLSAAKAQVTKMERIIAQYVEYMSQNDLFFNPETDERLLKANGKLERKIQHCALLHAELEQEVKQHQNSNSHV